MVTSTATSFFGMMIDSLNSSGECWDLQGCAGMGNCRVSSDHRLDHWCLADFCGKGRLACARVSTHCHEVLLVALHGCGDERK